MTQRLTLQHVDRKTLLHFIDWTCLGRPVQDSLENQENCRIAFKLACLEKLDCLGALNPLSGQERATVNCSLGNTGALSSSVSD